LVQIGRNLAVLSNDEGEGLGYEGWYIVAGMFVVTAVIFGSTIYAFIILTEQIAAEQSWSAAASGNLVSAMWLTSPLALLCAPLIVRVGAWRVLFAGLLVLSISFAATFATEEYWQIYLLRIAMGTGKTLAIVSMPVVISNLCLKRLVLAIAISWCGGAFGGVALTPLAQLLIADYGWRSTALVFAAIIFTTLIVIATLQRVFYSRVSASSGRGILNTNDAAGSYWKRLTAADLASAITMSFAVAASGIAVLAFAIEMPPFLEARGFSATLAATVLGLSAAGGMLGNLVAGWTMDHWRSGLTTCLVASAVGLGLTGFALLDVYPSIGLASAGSLLFGVGLGSAEILWITLTKRQFGAELFPLTYGGWSFSYAIGFALAGSTGAAVKILLPGEGFLLFIALLCVPTFIFSLWRPNKRTAESVAVSTEIR